MELKNKRTAWAALATLGVTAIAAGATAFVKIREKQRQRELHDELKGQTRLSAEQQMVYNEAVSAFLTINDRIYELRQYRKELQPLISWLVSDGERPAIETDNKDVLQLADDIDNFQTTQMPFINACLRTLSDDGTTYSDYVRGAVGGTFDDALDEEPTGIEVKNGTPITFVLKLGYYFPECSLALQPVKSIVLV